MEILLTTFKVIYKKKPLAIVDMVYIVIITYAYAIRLYDVC